MNKQILGYSTSDVKEYLENYNAFLESRKKVLNKLIDNKEKEKNSILNKIEMLKIKHGKAILEFEKVKPLVVELQDLIDGTIHYIKRRKDSVKTISIDNLISECNIQRDMIESIICFESNRKCFNAIVKNENGNYKIAKSNNFWGFKIIIMDLNVSMFNSNSEADNYDASMHFKIDNLLSGDFWKTQSNMQIDKERKIDEESKDQTNVFYKKHIKEKQDLDDFKGINLDEIGMIRNNYICGNASGDDIFDLTGRKIISKNQIITNEIINIAEREGKLSELILNMILPDMRS